LLAPVGNSWWARNFLRYRQLRLLLAVHLLILD
jgi:hypothetical protein